MHPFMAVYIWSLSMSRVWQDTLTGHGALEMKPEPKQAPQTALRKFTPISILAGSYLKSEVTDTPLPDFILDKLADLHWVEQEPSMAI